MSEPSTEPGVNVAIVEFGLGNLFSVKAACEHAGMNATLSADASVLAQADAVILPGVGAFGDAMAELRRRDLVAPLRDLAASGKPLIGICLGLQLFMSEGFEFGRHEGLNLIAGDVVRFDKPKGVSGELKVPQVGWNRVQSPGGNLTRWENTPLEGQRDGVYQYFVHSFYAWPADPAVVCATTTYGDVTYCSSIQRDSLFACQFHPERSGQDGLAIYGNMKRWIATRRRN